VFAASAVTRTCVAWPVPDFSGSGSFLCSATTLGNVSLAARYGSFAFAANVSLGGFGTTISILLPKNPNFPLTQQSLPLAQPNLLPTRSISPMRKGHSRNTHTVPNGRSDSGGANYGSRRHAYTLRSLGTRQWRDRLVSISRRTVRVQFPSIVTRMIELAGSPDRVVPGHYMLQFNRFPMQGRVATIK